MQGRLTLQRLDGNTSLGDSLTYRLFTKAYILKQAGLYPDILWWLIALLFCSP